MRLILAASFLLPLLAASAQDQPPAAPPAAAQPAASQPAKEDPKKKPEQFDLGSILKGPQISMIGDTSWFTPEIRAKFAAAETKWPSNTTVRLYVGRIAGYDKDIPKAEAYLLNNPHSYSRRYLYESYLQHGLIDKFCQEYDKVPAPLYYDKRLEVAVKAKNFQDIERTILGYHSPTGALDAILKIGVDLDNIPWAYDALGRVALRVPADEAGTKLLTRIFAERDKLKVLFPDRIK